MMVDPVLSSLALWTPAGVWTNSAPSAQNSRADLTPWFEAPSLSTIHPRARRPHALAVALVQLAHVLLSAREEARDAPPLGRHEIDLLLGTVTGSTAADFDFYSGVQIRGAGFGSPSTFVYTLPTAALAEIALALGVRGSLATLTAGSISGIASVVRSASRISTGRARACICGGVEFARIGSRRASGSVEQDVIALFLLESFWLLFRWTVGQNHPRIVAISGEATRVSFTLNSCPLRYATHSSPVVPKESAKLSSAGSSRKAIG